MTHHSGAADDPGRLVVRRQQVFAIGAPIFELLYSSGGTFYSEISRGSPSPEWRNVSLMAPEKQKPNETRNATTTTNNKVKLSVCYLYIELPNDIHFEWISLLFLRKFST